MALLKPEWTLAPPSLPDLPQLLGHCQRLPGLNPHLEKVRASSQSFAILAEGSRGRRAGSVGRSARGFGVMQVDRLKRTNDKRC